MGAPKLRPVFVRKQERITLQAKQRADQLAREAEEETKRLAGERRRDTLKVCSPFHRYSPGLKRHVLERSINVNA